MRKYYAAIFVAFLFAFIVYAFNTWDTGFIVNAGESKEVFVGPSQECHKVTNTHPTYNYFIPTRTIQEWENFVSHLPPGVSVEDCCSINDFCWDGICGHPFTYKGKTYNTRLMPDGKCWMTENLNVGVKIPLTQVSQDNGIIEKYCYDDNEANCDIYGGLYYWSEAMQYTKTEKAQGICPPGWHIPSDGEWMALEASLGCTNYNDYLWRCDGLGWNGNRFIGLLNVLGGYCTQSIYGNYCEGKDEVGYWWSSTYEDYGVDWDCGYFRELSTSSSGVFRQESCWEQCTWSDYHPMSVRCVAD